MSKTRFELLDLGFAAEMCGNWEKGVKGNRLPNDWESIEQTSENKDKYVAKILRHLQGYVESESPAEMTQHLAAIACNANILWHLEGRRRQDE